MIDDTNHSNTTIKPKVKKIGLPIMIVVGFAIAFWLVAQKDEVKHKADALPVKLVDVIEVKALPFRAKVRAFGTVKPAITHISRAELSGKISFMHPDLKQGQGIPAGTVVIRIDASDYQVSLKQTEADLRANRQTLVQLEEENKTTLRSMDLAKENLAVGERELARVNDLWKKNLVSRSTLDSEKQKLISLQQQVEDLQGQLNSFASRRDSVQANIARAEQQVKGQQTTLGRTEIKMPFDARIGEVPVENNEFVSVGTTLFEALDINGVEIDAQLPIRHMANLVSHVKLPFDDGVPAQESKSIIKMMNLKAEVRLVGGLAQAKWAADVLRLGEAIDPTRRTLSVVIGIDDPYKKVIPGIRPPLLKGMYTAIDLIAPARDTIVIPRKAIHEGRVYRVSADNKLEIKAINVKFYQNDIAVIEAGLEVGDKIIVNDIYPVIDGIALKFNIDEDSQLWLVKMASGEA